MTQYDYDMRDLEIAWMMDILRRMRHVLDAGNYTPDEKVEAVRWLIKQALKVERE